MPQSPLDVTQAELAVLEVLWKEPSTIRQITDAIYGGRSTSEYATVQKLLERLEGKGCVKRNKRSFAHVFSASISRAELIDSGLESLAQKLCNGSLTPLLLHLTGSAKLTRDDREVLRKLIEGGRHT
jgi:predicted transcriptional regulator